MSIAKTFEVYPPNDAHQAAARHVRKVNEETQGIAAYRHILTDGVTAPVTVYRFVFEDGSTMDVGDGYGPICK